MKNECCGYRYTRILLYLFLAAVVSLSGCTDPEKAKADHIQRGEQYLKDLKYTEASLEFRNALQIDDSRARRIGDSPARSKDYSVCRK